MPKLPRTVSFPVPAKPTRYEILEGLRITAPVAAGYIPLGLAYGVLVIQLGLPWWLAPALSLSAYSGSAELLVVTLAAQNTPLAVIAVTMLGASTVAGWRAPVTLVPAAVAAGTLSAVSARTPVVASATAENIRWDMYTSLG